MISERVLKPVMNELIYQMP